MANEIMTTEEIRQMEKELWAGRKNYLKTKALELGTAPTPEGHPDGCCPICGETVEGFCEPCTRYKLGMLRGDGE